MLHLLCLFSHCVSSGVAPTGAQAHFLSADVGDIRYQPPQINRIPDDVPVRSQPALLSRNTICLAVI